MAQNRTSMRYTWVIKEFSRLTKQIEEKAQVTHSKHQIRVCGPDNKLYSDIFHFGPCKWRLMFSADIIFYLEVADFESLTYECRKNYRFKITIVNQIHKSRSIATEREHNFSPTSRQHVWKRLIKKSHLDARSGFLLSDSLVIQIEFLACTDLANSQSNIKQTHSHLNIQQAETLDTTPHRTEAAAVEVKRKSVEEGSVSKRLRLHENPKEDRRKDTEDQMVNFRGFQVRTSQQEVLTRIFDKHPNLVSNFRFQNNRLLSSFMDELLKIIDILCRSPHLVSPHDLDCTRTSLTDLKNAGLKVGWLDAKWIELISKKLKADGTRYAELRKQREDMKLKLEAMMKNIKNVEAQLQEAEAMAEKARIPLSIDDIV